MKTIWLLYILISFNGDPQLEIHEYITKQECEQEKVRVMKEVKEVYDIKDVQVHCILSAKNLK
jgi:hypothetical protein